MNKNFEPNYNIGERVARIAISPVCNLLDSRKTSHRPGTFSTEPEAVLSERGEPIGSSSKEKRILDGDGVSGDAGILSCQ